MIINKFGGASVKDAPSVKRMAEICKMEIQQGVVVVSAMGKTTNLLEKITQSYFHGNDSEDFEVFVHLHKNIIHELKLNSKLSDDVDALFAHLKQKLCVPPGLDYDFEYDQIVPYGELISTKIIAAYLADQGLSVKWIDIRKFLRTNNTYRDARVDWDLSRELIKKEFEANPSNIIITQGFIGSDKNNLSTTLGREGSDFTAAILGNILDAEKVTVWKDVPGILCADPQWLPDAPKIEALSYLDAIELAFFGAKVIHPKTIKPLQNKGIPLQVRSFLNLNEKGTFINGKQINKIPPVYIKKEKQVLISIKPTDFSFIVEENLSHIFGVFAKHQIKVNLMQNSAISFSVSVDNDLGRVPKVIEELRTDYSVKYNEELELITIRHTIPGAEDMVLKNRTVLVEQKSRLVARYVVR